MLSYHLLTRVLTRVQKPEPDAPAFRIACAVSSVVHGLVPHEAYAGIAERADRAALREPVLRARVALLLACDCSPLLDLVNACQSELQFVCKWNQLNAKLPLGVKTQLEGPAHTPQRTSLTGRDSAVRAAVMDAFLDQLRSSERRRRASRQPLRALVHDVLSERDALVELVECLFERPTAELAECALELGSSRRTVQRHLRSHGVTFLDLRQAVRITLGKDLLQRGVLSMTAVAIDAGFYDASHFCRALRASCGMAPRAYQSLFSMAES
jgi:AraC-like DNA-binding protein